MHAWHFFIFLTFWIALGNHQSFAQNKQRHFKDGYLRSSKEFLIFDSAHEVSILVGDKDLTVVRIAANSLSKDIRLLDTLNRSPKVILNDFRNDRESHIVIETMGCKGWNHDFSSQFKNLLIRKIAGKWEAFIIVVAKNTKGIAQLYIIGSDPRGTAFGIFELSRRLGVSPWVYWADVLPIPKKRLSYSYSQPIIQQPVVKYRGIFLNDEDWGLRPWASQKIDTACHNIGAKTYSLIFELLLRLKANCLWPAMHPGSLAFFTNPANKKAASDYQIIIGSSHCEPMLRNNVAEWGPSFDSEYHKPAGVWRYDQNRDQIQTYWKDRILQVKSQPVMITLGMRGIHDGGMLGPDGLSAKAALLSSIIKDQRTILSKAHFPPSPELFCLYKEVLTLYDRGVSVPKEVTLLWSDDNYGYLKRLPNYAEQLRPGGNGIYYHLSYWGKPADYLWLSSDAPAFISTQLYLAYCQRADRCWMINVGDLKPAEEELNFVMDLAWNPDHWRPELAYNYTEYWMKQIFGDTLGLAAAILKNDYYTLNQPCKPEHLDKASFSKREMLERLREWEDLIHKVNVLQLSIPDRLKNAYFELIAYPLKAAAFMNLKYINAASNSAIVGVDPNLSLSNSLAAYDSIKALTYFYNKVLASGKWDGMMNDHPRNLPVFGIPKTYRDSVRPVAISRLERNLKVLELYPTAWPFQKNGQMLSLICGVGSKKWGILRNPSRSSWNTDSLLIPFASFKMPDYQMGDTLIFRFLPSGNQNAQLTSRFGYSLDSGKIQWCDLRRALTENWTHNVINGFVEKKVSLPKAVGKYKRNELRIYFPSIGLVLTGVRLESKSVE